MNVLYKISIDRLNANYISGWCFHRIYPNRPVRLQCYQNNELRAETEASIFREDIKALGIHPSGQCGFEMITDVDFGFDFSQDVVIRSRDKSTVLADLSKIHSSGAGILRLGELWRLKMKKLSETAVFMHIPKTAGTSFNTLAQSIFPRGTAINHIELLPEASYSPLAKRYNYISGHLRFGQLKEHFDSDKIHFYTILREPYAHLHSHLKWLIQTAKNPEEKYFKATNPIIYELGKKLAGVSFSDKEALPKLVCSLNAIEAAFIDNLQTRYFLNQQPERITPGDLDTALDNCRQFRLVGITEQYEKFVRAFGELTSISTAIPPGKLNISTSEPLFDLKDQALTNILLPLVQCDLELYHSIAIGSGG